MALTGAMNWAAILFATITLACSSEALDFGRPDLGESRDMLPLDVATVGSCVETPAYADCTYESRGLYYSVFGDVVIRKEIGRVNGVFKRGLPFGLSPLDAPEDVRIKLSNMNVALVEVPEASGTVLYAPVSEHGLEFDLYFEFGKDATLQVVGVSLGESGQDYGDKDYGDSALN